MLKSSDPAPSRLFYKINRLFYRLWFKLILITVFFVATLLLTKKFVYNNVDLNAEIRLLSEEGSALYKGLTELSISRISVKGAQASLEKEIKNIVQYAATEGLSALKAQALREKIQAINKVEKAFVKFSTDGLVIVKVIERKEAIVFFKNDLYEVLDRNGVILSTSEDYSGLSRFPLLVGKNGTKKINELLSIVDDIGPNKSKVLYYEWVGERRWNIHMRNDLVFKLPEYNLSKGLELMLIFLKETNEIINPIISVDLRNLDKPIIKFRKTPPFKYLQEKTERLAG